MLQAYSGVDLRCDDLKEDECAERRCQEADFFWGGVRARMRRPELSNSSANLIPSSKP